MHTTMVPLCSGPIVGGEGCATSDILVVQEHTTCVRACLPKQNIGRVSVLLRRATRGMRAYIIGTCCLIESVDLGKVIGP